MADVLELACGCVLERSLVSTMGGAAVATNVQRPCAVAASLVRGLKRATEEGDHEAACFELSDLNEHLRRDSDAVS